MRQSVTVTGSAGGAAVSNWVPINHRETNFNVSLAYFPGTTGLADVQHTFDTVQVTGTTLRPFNHETITSAAASADGNYDFPCEAIRLNVRAGASGDHELIIIQTGY